jgi:hypothetical protein
MFFNGADWDRNKLCFNTCDPFTTGGGLHLSRIQDTKQGKSSGVNEALSASQSQRITTVMAIPQWRCLAGVIQLIQRADLVM